MIQILLTMIAYLVIPFILFTINDWFAGYWRDRIRENLGVYTGDNFLIFLIHVFWPITALFLVGAWIYHLAMYKFDIPNLDKIYKAGEAKRERDQDLDIQADKFLLGYKHVCEEEDDE